MSIRANQMTENAQSINQSINSIILLMHDYLKYSIADVVV